MYSNKFNILFFFCLKLLILDEAVLNLQQLYRNDLFALHAVTIDDVNKSYRHAAYRRFVLCQFGRLTVSDRGVLFPAAALVKYACWRKQHLYRVHSRTIQLNLDFCLSTISCVGGGETSAIVGDISRGSSVPIEIPAVSLIPGVISVLKACTFNWTI